MKKLTLITIIILLFLPLPANAMLAKYWRLRIQLGSAMETLTYDNAARATLRLSPWKLVSGTLTYGATITEDFDTLDAAGETIAANGEGETGVQDNTSNLYWGIKGYFEIIADVNPTIGTVYLWLEESDDNTNWPSDQADFDCDEDLILVATMSLSTDTVDEDRAINFDF